MLSHVSMCKIRLVLDLTKYSETPSRLELLMTILLDHYRSAHYFIKENIDIFSYYRYMYPNYCIKFASFFKDIVFLFSCVPK